jgi:hypothetical protein
VTKPIETKGVITIKDGGCTAQSTFTVNRKDYNIIGESFVQKKIAEQIQVTIDLKFDKR